MNYYNDNNPHAAAWLDNLQRAREIPHGVVDSRDIRHVRSSDLSGFTQCHFFAGIGGWPLALRLAGWPEDWPVWTASCPCQPFSNAGKRRGEDDDRHLWPIIRERVAECRPAILFGEQVASADGRAWFARVRLDLEELGYAVGCSDLCAAGVGAPHMRQRLFFGAVRLGNPDDNGRQAGREAAAAVGYGRPADATGGLGGVGLADADDGAGNERRSDERRSSSGSGAQPRARLAGGNSAGRVADADGTVAQRDGRPRQLPRAASPLENERHERERRRDAPANLGAGERGRVGDTESGRLARPASVRRPLVPELAPVERTGFWDDGEWLNCRDGKARRIKPGVPLLVDGLPRDVAGALSGFGNAIVPEVAAIFIEAFCDASADVF